MNSFKRLGLSALICAATVTPGLARASDGAAPRPDYKVLATNKTSTMQKELNEAAAAGFRFQGCMGGETAFGGSETLVITAKAPDGRRYEYRLLATSKTSTMQKELQAAGNEGFEYKGQTVFGTAFGGKEVVVILERESSPAPQRVEYRLLATSKTSTMQKELQAAANEGWEFLGVTVGETAFGGDEVVTILRRSTAAQ